MNVNNVTVTCFVGSQIQDRTTPSGTRVASFIARIEDENKGKVYKQWIPVQCYGKLADEVIKTMPLDDDLLMVVGKLSSQKQGEKDYRTCIMAQQVFILARNRVQEQTFTTEETKSCFEESDIPF